MPLEINDENDSDTNTTLFQRREALRHAAAVGCGVVRVTDGKSERTYANTWVAAGREVVLDLSG